METPAELFGLTDKIAIVTGGSRGIGRAVAEGFAMAGADVVIASRKLDNCERAAKEIENVSGRRALAVAYNASVWDDSERLADTVYDHFGRCDILVNNAGSSPPYPDLVSVTEDLYDKTHAINARGPFRLGALIGKRMYDGDGGSIINVTSAGSLRPEPFDLPYAMAKAGLNALTLGLVGAYSPKVRANTAMPGPYDTDVTQHWAPGTVERASEMNPLKRIGQPRDLVGVCIFLASDAARYVNGATILADGGAFRAL